jgi:hypothetical protein
LIDLSAYAGSSVSIQISAECDSYENSNLFIDHVEFRRDLLDTNSTFEDIINIDGSSLKWVVSGK